MLEEAEAPAICGIDVKRITFNENLVGVDEELSQVSQINITVPAENMEALQEIFTANKKRLFNEQSAPPSRPFYLRSRIMTQTPIATSLTGGDRGSGSGEGRV